MSSVCWAGVVGGPASSACVSEKRRGWPMRVRGPRSGWSYWTTIWWCSTAGSRMKSWMGWVPGGGNVVLGEDAQPFRAGLGGEGLLELRHQLAPVVPACEPGTEARVVGHLGLPDGLAELAEEGLVADGEEDPLAVARLVDAIRRRVAIHRLPAGIVHHAARLQRPHPPAPRGGH